MRVSKLITIVVLIFSVSHSFAQNLAVGGKIYDLTTNEGIPFATVHINGTSIGTCTNLEGEFLLKIPSEFMEGQVFISSMGFELEQLAIRESTGKSLNVGLKPSITQLETVTIRPISAQDYIARSVAKFSSNYGREFSANAYYRQQSTDFGDPLQFSEGYMQAYFSDFLDDTTEIDQRLLLLDVEDNLDQMKFRKKKREKKFEKAKKLAAKNEAEFDADSARSEARKVRIDLITPDVLMDQDPVRQLESFFDSTKFKKFNYTFENDITYRGKRVTVISFQSKGKVKLINVGLKGDLVGTIYVDQESEAIIGVDYDSEMVLPALAKPIIFLTGYEFSNPVIRSKVRYLQVGDKWFPQSIQMDMDLDLTKRYWFKKNEKSSIEVDLLMSVSNIESRNPIRIPEEFRFTRKKKFEEQVFPTTDSSWEEVNRIAIEQIEE
ncbi:MAG: carboxypeptidase-like regulatory domain-containing protein [Cyclobacteriaceae bacterium]